jgi:TonB family protein
MKKTALILLVSLLGYHLGQAQTTKDEDKVHSFVSMKNPPKFPGGMAKFYKYLGENIKYPEQAKKDNIQGNVFMSFVVEKDGSVRDVKTLRGLSTETNQEAERVLKLSPKWDPGMLDGKAVRVVYNLPIKFANKTGK